MECNMEAHSANTGITYRSKAEARKALYSDRKPVKSAKPDGEPIFAKVLYIIAIASLFFAVLTYSKSLWEPEHDQLNEYYASVVLAAGFFQCVLFTFLGKVIVYLHRIAKNTE